jgi:hypothetical protein
MSPAVTRCDGTVASLKIDLICFFSILTITYDFFVTIRFDLGQRPGPAGSPPGAPVSTDAARCLSTRQARSATPKRNATPLDSAQVFRDESKESRSA